MMVIAQEHGTGVGTIVGVDQLTGRYLVRTDGGELSATAADLENIAPKVGGGEAPPSQLANEDGLTGDKHTSVGSTFRNALLDDDGRQVCRCADGGPASTCPDVRAVSCGSVQVCGGCCSCEASMLCGTAEQPTIVRICGTLLGVGPDGCASWCGEGAGHGAAGGGGGGAEGKARDGTGRRRGSLQNENDESSAGSAAEGARGGGGAGGGGPPQQEGTVSGSIFNLCNCMLGVGVLALPAAMQRVGVVRACVPACVPACVLVAVV
jgi:hypothetical protein